MSIEQVCKKLNIKHSIKYFKKSHKTKIVGETLYYKNIPSAVLFLNHLNLNKTALIDDGFKVKGTMIDLSRNAVFTRSYFETVILKHAQLGFNEIWLYMEDVFELKDYPKFGYLRGKYKSEDIMALDHYAKTLGITLVPCIQTLGHMSQFLRWSSSDSFKDQSDVLLVSEKTNQLIQAIFDFCRKSFTTDKIHIGMDETFGFSFGQYYKLNGYSSPDELFLAHLNKVYALAKTSGYKNIYMWSDMFFRHRSKSSYYYDTSITIEDDLSKQLPQDITMVYWDYYNYKPEIYEAMIENHQKLKRKVVLASGTWIWTRLAYDQQKTLTTAAPAIAAAKKYGIDEIIFTQWNDDGAYCDYETSYLGLYDVTNIIHNNQVSKDYLSYIGCRDYLVLSKVSQISHLGYNAVQLLWDDLLLGIYLNDLVGYSHEKLDIFIKKTDDYIESTKDINYPYYTYLASVLKNKLELRKVLLKGYFEDQSFSDIEPLIITIRSNLTKTLELFEQMWLSRNKVFGLEVIQNRLFSQFRRIQTYADLIKSYVPSSIIPYLEEVISKEPYLSEKHMAIAFSSKV